MERKFIKKIVIAIVLSSIIFLYSLTKVSSADVTPIDLNALNDISTDSGNTTGNNTTVNNTVNNTTKVNNTSSNNSVANTSSLPQTGSNNEIIFVVGITILAGTTIFMYRKTKML